jgi:phosphoribosyl-ATP pyrophosphohydrolase
MTRMNGFSLERLAETVAVRAASGDPGSYTARLVAKGTARCAKKLGEEAVEAAIAAVAADRDGLRAEAADLLYHLLVLLHVAGVPFEEVIAELGRRTSETGLQEKARRGSA